MFRLHSFLFLNLLFISSSLWALSGTSGTPIGGMGTGYVVYNGVTGEFATSGKMPPPGADGYEFTNRKSSSAGFYFYVNGKSISKAKAVTEDAKCPLYFSDFGSLENVNFTLNAFGPFIPGDSPDNFKLATSPLAFFEISATNNNNVSAEISVALEFANTSGSASLLGGAPTGTVESGNQSISYNGIDENAYLAVDCDVANPVYSAGDIGTYISNGILSNTAGNLVSAKCTIPANGTARFKFTLAWWRKFESTTDRYGYGLDLENYLYHNYYANSREAAAFGRAKFDAVKNGLTSFVYRVWNSNFPSWYKDRLLNNTYPLIHNAQCAKDGRITFWEGRFAIIGTIDQGEHASLFYTFNWPQVQWQELQYWKRTSHQGNELNGQIHHDVNMGYATSFKPENLPARFMCPWDDSKHSDYAWVENTTTWSDLNSMFIFKAYELMLATGNLDSMKTYFPAIKATAERIIAQAAQSNTIIPLASHSTYDEKVNGQFSFTPEYCGGIALTTYLAFAEIARFVGQDSVAERFLGYYKRGRIEYKEKYNNNPSYATGRDYSEGDVAGYSWANYFGFEPVMDSGFITSANSKLWNYYNKRTETDVDTIRSKLGKWNFYTYDHWGGVEIALGKPDTALIIHKWDYKYFYELAPNMVFWQNSRKELSEKNTYASYMTAPSVWRSYFQMLGYMIDNANQKIYIRPKIPSEMNKEIKNAILLNPKSLGTLNYNEILEGTRTQTMTIAFDAPVTIKEFILKNNTNITDPSVAISNNGVAVSGYMVKAEGSGFEKNIRVTLSSPVQIGPEGVKIDVFASPVNSKGIRPISPSYPLSLKTGILKPQSKIHFSVDKPGPVSMELFSLNGGRIGVIMQDNMSAGEHILHWNGKTINGKKVSSLFALLRLSSARSAVTKAMLVIK